ncbi:MAG: flagellar hook-length control protein FliK [Alphaproteobacteria bacterium]
MRSATGNTPGQTASDSLIRPFAEFLSSDMFSDASDRPTPDAVYDELDTLTARDDWADDASAYDDLDDNRNEDADPDWHSDDDRASDQNSSHEDANRSAADAGENAVSSPTALQQALTAGTIPTTGNMSGSAALSGTQLNSPQAGDAAAGATSPPDQLNAALAGTGSAAPGAANLSEVRVLNRRSRVLQANAQHVETAKSQLAKAEGATANPAARTAAQSTDTAKPASAPQEASQPKSEAGRLDQVFRAAFPQNASTSAATTNATPNLAQGQPATQNAVFADSLTAASSGDGGDTNTQVQNSAERTNTTAAAKTAATRTPFNLPGSRPAEQVSVQIQNAARSGTDRISIRLSPAALGKVEVKLELSPDKTVQAIVTAEKPETLDMLERDARTLQRALEEAGLRTNSDSLSFERRDPGASADTASDPDGQSSDGTNRSEHTEHDDGHGQIEAEAADRRHHDGLLDVEV